MSSQGASLKLSQSPTLRTIRNRAWLRNLVALRLGSGGRSCRRWSGRSRRRPTSATCEGWTARWSTTSDSNNLAVARWPLCAVRRALANCPGSFQTPAAQSGTSSAPNRSQGQGGMSRFTGTIRSTLKSVWNSPLHSPGMAKSSARPPQPVPWPQRPITGRTASSTGRTRRFADGAGARGTRWQVPTGRSTGHWNDEWNCDPTKIRTDVFHPLVADGSSAAGPGAAADGGA
ncbi:hypothetical protein BSF38_03344 [Paludisphaera borealis]|uniref:Uncharacterized protein n=1 Tax=Paludisphaera borealis TaxID=1387353 RepID=A0A1U7CS97_9BACT|nr:hypothetical protein BSF38_03344 [Paludisphaera borealis]